MFLESVGRGSIRISALRFNRWMAFFFGFAPILLVIGVGSLLSGTRDACRMYLLVTRLAEIPHWKLLTAREKS